MSGRSRRAGHVWPRPQCGRALNTRLDRTAEASRATERDMPACMPSVWQSAGSLPAHTAATAARPSSQRPASASSISLSRVADVWFGQSASRASANRRSVGASGIAARSCHEAQRIATCSLHSGSPSATTGIKTMRNGDPGSRNAAIGGAVTTTWRPNSSMSSRRSASRSDSTPSTFPPGNSHMPPCRLPGGRSATRTRSPRSITAATTLVRDADMRRAAEMGRRIGRG